MARRRGSVRNSFLVPAQQSAGDLMVDLEPWPPSQLSSGRCPETNVFLLRRLFVTRRLCMNGSIRAVNDVPSRAVDHGCDDGPLSAPQ